jgi:tRNA uridine 5-carbamoylmethylation protein Kti12
MNYTRNLGMKLRAQGFEFQSSVKNKEVDYEDFKKDDIEVTVDHEMQMATIVIVSEFGEDLDINGVRTMSELKMLHRLIYGAKSTRINNEDGD